MSGLTNYSYAYYPFGDDDKCMSAIITKPTKAIVHPAPRKVGDEIEHKPRHASDDEIKKHYHGIQTRDEN